MEHGYTGVETAHKGDVVLDDDDGLAGEHVADKVRRARRLGESHARGRFVQKNQLRVVQHYDADFQPLLLPVRKIAGANISLVHEFDVREHRFDPVFERVRPFAAQQPKWRHRPGAAGHEIVQYRHLLEHGWDLELQADAQLTDFVNLQSGDLALVEFDPPPVGL